MIFKKNVQQISSQFNPEKTENKVNVIMIDSNTPSLPTPPTAPDKVIKRDPKGRWLPGYAPKSKGRPPGSRSRFTEVLLSQASVQDFRTAYKILWTHIRNGNFNALKFFLEFFTTPMKQTIELTTEKDEPNLEELRKILEDRIKAENATTLN